MISNELKQALRHLYSIDDSLKKIAKCLEESNNADPYIQDYRRGRFQEIINGKTSTMGEKGESI